MRQKTLLPGAAALRIRIVFPGGFMMGPGKADLLDLIGETGSISAAGRRMKMSYKRAWMLVETMNAGFKEPLVISSRGGAKGGGAYLTETGRSVLRHYRDMEENCARAAQVDVAAIAAHLSDISGGK